MSIWTLVCIAEITIFAIIINRLIKEKRITEQVNTKLGNIIAGNRAVMQKQKHCVDELQVSLINASNTQKFVNKCNQMPTFCHKRYIKVHQRELCYQGVVQVVYAVFYEDDYSYTGHFMEIKPVDFDINRDVCSFKLNCMMFIDGEQLDPSLNQYIMQDSNSLKIEELNMYKHEGKGAGSFYLYCLSKEILRYPQIHYIHGDLSSVDMDKRDKLIHFYEKNGFEKIKPMSECAWGHVTKTIRQIKDDVLKLDHRDITFGIEIEFQIRNGNRPTEIAKEMFKFGLSDCDEVKLYNQTDDKGWKIIKEKTCDYEIISPVLTDSKQCWEEINLICCILTKYGAYTDDYCAFHIHIGTKDLLTEGRHWTVLMDAYRYLEPITCILSKGEFESVSRRRLKYFAITMAKADSLWCKESSIDEYRGKIEKGDMGLMPSFYRTRNIGMNWRCMSEVGESIEFRTFNGTIDFYLIQTYLMYICNLVDKVSQKKENEFLIGKVLIERNITKEYITNAINYLTDDKYIGDRLRMLVRQCGNTLDDFTWDMLNGIGDVDVDKF